MRGNGYVGELVLSSINFCYCYLLYVAEAVVACPRTLETIYPIGWRGGNVMKRLIENWRALRGSVGIDEECRWSEEYNSDVVKHAGKKTV
jgi:hypothetical protein